ncbi:hypothetical protein MLD38_011220 [Melastoma candidum]|uniref:Uncharacterized protein n=1 Tax=Melastoma candidum TaxID=119954 RepID=A0ACB9R3N6_9MYRT|nr:hypothetical protein MLD38_011220 [Melastoma candidum]
MGSRKGKEVASGDQTGVAEFKTGRYKRKRTDAKRAVLQFFEDSAAEVDADDDDEADGLSSCDSFFDDHDFMEEEFDSGPNKNIKSNVSKANCLPIFPKEEQFEEEIDKMMEERYKKGASFVRYAEDDFETKKFIEKDSHPQTTKEPIIWKVKCMVGRERYSAFCLMQKFVDLQNLGEKLKMVSAFAVDHVKGHIFIEADKQPEVHESCKGLCSIYTSRVVPVPRNEVSQLFSVRSRQSEVSEGMWCRVKSGNYKGDLAQIVAVNNEKRRATLKLIPRIDIQALSERYGGGSSKRGRSNSTIPAPRLISSGELEEFRPLVSYRRDRDTGMHFEVMLGMMLKDGYLYKRASLDSLTLWGVVPSDEELLKFQPSDNGESKDLEWLSQLYGDQMKKRSMQYEKGGEKGEGSSKKVFNLYELVAIGPKSFGLIVGVEKEDSFLILREGLEGQEVFSAGVYEITNGPIHAKFTALDHHNKTISVNDTVLVLEGLLKDRQGTVKQIYRGVVFALDENEVENGGYFCFKAQLCEKVKPAEEMLVGKDGETRFCGGEDLPSSPKSPLSPRKPWEARENRNNFNQGDRDGPFSIGQTLRIRVGPLKGYLCRVIAIRRSEVTVKLDSQQRVLTVKSEHLAELRVRNSALSIGDDQDDGSTKLFDLRGNTDHSSGWLSGSGTSASTGGWNTGSATSSWPSLPSSGFAADPSGSAVNDSTEETGWGKKAAQEPWSSWGAAASEDKIANKTDHATARGAGEDSWSKASSKGNSSSSTFGNWAKKSIEPTAWHDNKEKTVPDDSTGKKADLSWDKGEEDKAAGWNNEAWKNSKNANGNDNSSWNSWNKTESGSTMPSNAEGSWGKGETGSAGDLKLHGDTSWSKGSRDSSWIKQNAGSSWGQMGSGNNKTEGSSWSQDNAWDNATDGGSPWVKPTDTQKQDGAGSSWSTDGKESSWNKQDTSSWGQPKGGNEEQRSYSWAKDGTHGGSSWNSQPAAPDGPSSWSKGGIGSWNKQNANSSWDQSGVGSDRHKGSSQTKDGILGSVPSSWNKQNDKEDETFSSWGKDKHSTWGGTGELNSSDAPKGSGRGQGGRDWGRGRTYNGGRGSGGRRGRGGPGGCSRFGGGQWSGQEQTSGGKDEGEINAASGNDGWKPISQSTSSWGRDKDLTDGRESSWGKGGSESAGWGKGGSDTQNAERSWGNPNSFGVKGESSWGNHDNGGSSWNNQAGSSWKDGAGAGSSWGKSDGGAASWDKQNGGSWKDGGEDKSNNRDFKGGFGGLDRSNSWSNQKPSERGESLQGNSANPSWGQQDGESNKFYHRNSSGGDDASWDKKDASEDNSWNKGKSVVEDPLTNWNKQKSEGATDTQTGDDTPWKKEPDSGNNQNPWKKSDTSCRTVTEGGKDQTDSWSQKSSVCEGGSWSKNARWGGSLNDKKDVESVSGSKSKGNSWGSPGGSNNDTTAPATLPLMIGGKARATAAGDQAPADRALMIWEKGRVTVAGGQTPAAPALITGEKAIALVAGGQALAPAVWGKVRALVAGEEVLALVALGQVVGEEAPVALAPAPGGKVRVPVAPVVGGNMRMMAALVAGKEVLALELAVGEKVSALVVGKEALVALAPALGGKARMPVAPAVGANARALVALVAGEEDLALAALVAGEEDLALAAREDAPVALGAGEVGLGMEVVVRGVTGVVAGTAEEEGGEGEILAPMVVEVVAACGDDGLKSFLPGNG